MKRLNVRIHEADLRDLERAARGGGVTTSAFVRQAIREAVQRDGTTVEDRLALIRAASGHAFPSGDIETLVADIERGYTA